VKKFRSSILVLFALFICGAIPVLGADKKKDVNSIGGRKVAHRSVISQEKEIAIGRHYASEIDHAARLLQDTAINEYVNRVAQNVARNSDLTLPLTVKVIESPEINAFALPGGFLYVNTGLLLAADEEDQVAGVMAHEIAHVAARHWASQQTKASILQYAAIPLIFTPMSFPVYAGASEALNFGVPLTFLKFSRSAEAEADYLGLQYLVKAGYDPNSYVAFFGKIMQEERRRPGSVPKIFLDHPPTAERIVRSEEEIKEVLPKRDQYLVSTSEFVDIRARLQAATGNRSKQKGESAPTLSKRDASTEPTASQTQSGEKGHDESGEKPPVLRRRS
jgi:predicted Zn-dependent protease